MNRRRIIIASTVLTIIALAVWRGWPEPPKQIAPPKLSSDSASGEISPKPIKEPEAKQEYEAVTKEKSIAFANRNNAPITFFGQVIDQDGKPLDGVTVDYYVTAIPAIPALWGPDERTKGSCLTDQNGLFSVAGMRGVSFGVTTLTKTGYRESGHYEQGHARYEPHNSGRHVPDRDRPVAFMLIREDLPKAEEVYDKRLRLNWNAESTIVDFGPDIGRMEFTASRSGWDPNNSIKKFEWEVKMRATGFTLAKLPNANERMAPLAGYGANERVGYSPDEATWQLRPDESYAIHTALGAYGLMNISVYGDGDDGMSGRVTVYLNKSGARNMDHK